MRIITVAFQKGGVGKSTTAAAIAQAAACKGKRVLAVDADPQGNLSFCLGANTATAGTLELLEETAKAADLIQTTEQGIDIIPANWELAAVTSGKGSARRLQKALLPVKERYDYCIIDTPTAAGELQLNALMAADGLVIPLQADAYNLQTLYQMADTVAEVQNSNPDLRILGIVLTMHSDRTTLARQMKETITEEAAAMGIPYLGDIRKAICVQEAAALQESLFKYAPNSKPASDYMRLFDSIDNH